MIRRDRRAFLRRLPSCRAVLTSAPPCVPWRFRARLPGERRPLPVRCPCATCSASRRCSALWGACEVPPHVALPEGPRRIGFTGTQIGCTDVQVAALARTLAALGCKVLHHGDCIGADEVAHRIARAMGARVELHPPRNGTKRARCEMLPGETTHPAKEYIPRNHDIVNATTVLVACPKEEEGEELRSGTWATVRYARKLHRPVYIVRPSGRVEEERAPTRIVTTEGDPAR